MLEVSPEKKLCQGVSHSNNAMDEEDVVRHNKKAFFKKNTNLMKIFGPHLTEFIWLTKILCPRLFLLNIFFWIPTQETSPQTNVFLFQAGVPEDNGNAVGFLNCSLKGLGVKPIKPNFLQLSSDRASFCNTCTKATLARGFLVTWSTEALIGSHNCLRWWESWVSRTSGNNNKKDKEYIHTQKPKMMDVKR